MVDKCTLFTSHTYICIYSYKIQNTVDCHPDNDWATIPCLPLAPWLTSWLAVFCSLTNMMQDPFAAVGMCQIWKILVRFPCTSLSSHRVTKRSNSAFWHFANIPSSFRAVVGISLAGSCCLWFLFLGGLNSCFQSFHTRNSYNMQEYSHFWRFLWCSLSVAIIYLHFTWNLIRAQTKTPKEASSDWELLQFTEVPESSVKINFACLKSVTSGCNITSTVPNYTEMIWRGLLWWKKQILHWHASSRASKWLGLTARKHYNERPFHCCHC